MYIRRRIHKRKNGEVRIGYGLLECRRVHGQPKQKTILNLGHNFDIEEADWNVLTDRVRALLRGQPPLPVDSIHIQKAAEDIARRLQASGYDPNVQLDDRDAVIIDDVHHEDVRTVGGERVGLKALEQLGFMDLLRQLGLSEDYVRLAAALVIGRMMSPGSEAHTHHWMMGHSAILELVQMDPPSASTLYRVGDQLFAHREAIMQGLFDQTKQLLGFEETILFYDLTNVYYTGRKKGALLRYGRSKEKRSDCPLVTLALALDASGFPVRVEILAGNVSEPGTLQSALAHLKGRKPTVIMDAGIATKANLAYLKAQALNWICVERSKTPPAPTTKPDKVLTTRANAVVKAWSLSSQPGEQRVYLQSEARKITGDRILQQQRERFENDLKKLHAGLSKPGCLKNYDKVVLKLGRLKQRHKRVSSQYNVQVGQTKDHPNATAVIYTHTSAYSERTQASGGYVLRTSHTGWSVSEVARTYWRLTDIERTFRTMKSDLGLRPIYHSKDDRIEAHLFISVLAYHAVQLIRSQLKARGVHDSWTHLQYTLNHWQRITTILPQSQDRSIRLTKDADPTEMQRYIASIMGIHATGFTRKTTIQTPTKV